MNRTQKILKLEKRIAELEGKGLLGRATCSALAYHQQQDGEWIAPTRGYRMACCDCGLVHRMEFRVVNGKVQFRAWRDNRATVTRRRKFPAMVGRWYKLPNSERSDRRP